MARTLVAATTLVLTTVLGVRPADAREQDDAIDEVALVAAEAGVSPTDLRGAVNSVGVAPRTYLVSVGELAPPRLVDQAVVGSPPASAFERRIECLIRYESGGSPTAVNRSSGAAGLLQFLPSTWAGTPQGRAGLSVFDPQAARAAAAWMLSQGRAREWTPVRLGLC